MILEKELRAHLNFIYGSQQAEPIYDNILDRLTDFRRRFPELGKSVDPNERVTEADSILITYGDLILSEDRTPLKTLADTVERFFADVLKDE